VGGARDGKAHLPARQVGQPTNRIDGLEGGACTDQDATTGQAARTERVGDVGHEVDRLAHAALSHLAAGLLARRRPEHGDAALAQQVSDALGAAGIAHQHDPADGMDHGTWVPLLMMYPQADIPVVTLSTLPRQDAAAHYRLGQALAGLAAQDILIIGSGSVTHNLYALGAPGTPAQPWAQAFADWVAQRLQQGDVAGLLNWQADAPFGKQNHPTDEHLLPLFFALGAANGRPARSLHRGIEYASVTMDAWDFAGTASEAVSL